ncbi:MAG TPA: iron-containing alcohol dehydrogenase [Vicinamibacteria bacterium]|nr:iron-containing alcohol dehydrogenase [Vicinamibacteria bacterium]
MSLLDRAMPTRVVFAPGALRRLGEIARELGFTRTLLVSDPGLVGSGHPARARALLEGAGIEVVPFHDFDHDPDAAMAARGAEVARAARVDSIVALGGGSSLDCAKGLNFLLTGGGEMADYRGYGKASRPLLPMVAVPTTAGTGSEAQSYALISDTDSHDKMACGDPKAAFRVAVLDPELTVSQPPGVTATAGFDALSHAVESYVTTRRNALSVAFAGQAFVLLEAHFERVLAAPQDLEARGAMLMGAHLAGLAIEASMLGATHACANPLSARYGTTHGAAIALLLPHVVRWNARAAAPLYADLLRAAGREPGPDPAETLAVRLDSLAVSASLPRHLGQVGVAEGDLALLADDAGRQWTGGFNPRPFDRTSALELYRAAF